MASRVPPFIDARRSIRAFLPEPVPRDALDGFVEAACAAPAPHHSRPWRWVIVDRPDAKERLAAGMGAQWRVDLEGDGVPTTRIDELVAASHAKVAGAPAVVLGCLTWDGLDRYPDETRRRAEWGMALLSLGAAVENFMIAAAAAEYASCWVAAPIFCPEAGTRRARPRSRVAPPRDDRGGRARPGLRRATASTGSPGSPPRLPVAVHSVRCWALSNRRHQGREVVGEHRVGRRTFMGLLAAGSVVGVALTTDLAGPAARAVAAPTALQPADGVVALGKAYLKTHPGEAHLEVLLGRLPGVDTTSDLRTQLPALSGAITKDFRAGRVVTVQGWQLSRTEARAAAAVALGA